MSINEHCSTDAIKSILSSRWTGIWKGQGRALKQSGDYASSYNETLNIAIVRSSPTFVVLEWHQDAHSAESGKPMHRESGFIRIETHDTRQRFVASAGFTHSFPAGILTEICKGTFTGESLELTARDFERTSPGQKKPRSYLRQYSVNESNVMTYTQYMNDILHLTCELTRAE